MKKIILSILKDAFVNHLYFTTALISLAVGDISFFALFLIAAFYFKLDDIHSSIHATHGNVTINLPMEKNHESC